MAMVKSAETGMNFAASANGSNPAGQCGKNTRATHKSVTIR
jgi:hypothetical protein